MVRLLLLLQARVVGRWELQCVSLVEPVMGCHLFVVYVVGKVRLLLDWVRLLGLTLEEGMCCLAVVHASTTGGLELVLLLLLHA